MHSSRCRRLGLPGSRSLDRPDRRDRLGRPGPAARLPPGMRDAAVSSVSVAWPHPLNRFPGGVRGRQSRRCRSRLLSPAPGLDGRLPGDLRAYGACARERRIRRAGGPHNLADRPEGLVGSRWRHRRRAAGGEFRPGVCRAHSVVRRCSRSGCCSPGSSSRWWRAIGGRASPPRVRARPSASRASPESTHCSCCSRSLSHGSRSRGGGACSGRAWRWCAAALCVVGGHATVHAFTTSRLYAAPLGHGPGTRPATSSTLRAPGRPGNPGLRRRRHDHRRATASGTRADRDAGRRGGPGDRQRCRLVWSARRACS